MADARPSTVSFESNSASSSLSDNLRLWVSAMRMGARVWTDCGWGLRDAGNGSAIEKSSRAGAVGADDLQLGPAERTAGDHLRVDDLGLRHEVAHAQAERVADHLRPFPDERDRGDDPEQHVAHVR